MGAFRLGPSGPVAPINSTTEMYLAHVHFVGDLPSASAPLQSQAHVKGHALTKCGREPRRYDGQEKAENTVWVDAGGWLIQHGVCRCYLYWRAACGVLCGATRD